MTAKYLGADGYVGDTPLMAISKQKTPNPPTPKASAWQALTRHAIAKRRRNVLRPIAEEKHT